MEKNILKHIVLIKKIYFTSYYVSNDMYFSFLCDQTVAVCCARMLDIWDDEKTTINKIKIYETEERVALRKQGLNEKTAVMSSVINMATF